MRLKLETDAATFAELERRFPDNPFCSQAYADSRTLLGEKPVVITALSNVLPGFVRRGRFSASLEIPSVPEITVLPVSSIALACGRAGMFDRVTVNTFAARDLDLAGIDKIQTGATSLRTEHLLALDSYDAEELSKAHKRNISKAEKAQLIICEDGEKKQFEFLLNHVLSSLERRESRGEVVGAGRNHRWLSTLFNSSCARSFYAERDCVPVASMLLLCSGSFAYYLAAGGTEEARETGAAHLLVHQTALKLKAGGFKLFNLGGSPQSGGLYRFKSGFGGAEIPLMSFNVFPFSKPKTLANKFRRGVQFYLQGALKSSFPLERQVK